MTQNGFQAHINGNKPVLVDFFVKDSLLSNQMHQVLKELKEAVGDTATILKLDIDKNESFVHLFNIQATPTLIIFKNGRVRWRKNGSSSLSEMIQQLAVHVL